MFIYRFPGLIDDSIEEPLPLESACLTTVSYLFQIFHHNSSPFNNISQPNKNIAFLDLFTNYLKFELQIKTKTYQTVWQKIMTNISTFFRKLRRKFLQVRVPLLQIKAKKFYKLHQTFLCKLR